MQREMFRAKIHRARVTQLDLNYHGSITIDQDLLDLTDIWHNERVQIVNANNGARLETYVIAGKRGSRVIGLNGPAARLAMPGDIISIISYGIMDEKEARQFKPKVILLNANNEVIESHIISSHDETLK
ncbi:aspartate 1-decarboxylase [bacterium]|nr:aspartate 1-decarboxylase [bacterium]